MADGLGGRTRELARRARERLRERDPGLRARVERLEKELEADRQLHRKIAELSDVVTELLIPLQDRDETRVNQVLSAYRKSI
ncbi:DUF6752 domain-containing protein [Nocardioides sp.]|uniref:DUF6752 domain-containing protein n=1 Tax=Nocardioides sp. TaxID=35761 RepID=UPI0039E3B637